MKIFSLLFLATSLLFAPNLNSSQEPPELQEAAASMESAAKLFREGNYNKALKQAKRALEIRERLLPSTDPRIATSLSYLGDIYFVKADYKAAEAAYQRALIVKEKSYGANSPQVARSLYQLGEVYRAKRDFTRGAESYRRALMILGPLSGVETREFERTSDRFMCLAWENRKPETVKEIEAIRLQFLPTGKTFEPYDILNGRALSLPKPEWPPIKVERGFSATVSIKVEIDETGAVVGVEDMCDAPLLLSGIAVAAAKKARFTPTKVQGQPIRVKGIIQYRFVREW